MLFCAARSRSAKHKARATVTRRFSSRSEKNRSGKIKNRNKNPPCMAVFFYIARAPCRFAFALNRGTQSVPAPNETMRRKRLKNNTFTSFENRYRWRLEQNRRKTTHKNRLYVHVSRISISQNFYFKLF